MRLKKLLHCEKKWSTIKTSYYLVIALYILSVLPLIYIGRYNHMTHDDYAFGLFAHRAWQESASILEALKAALEYTGWVFNHWQGTYASVFLMSLQPGIFSEKLYYITPLILIPMLSAGIFILFNTINKYIFKGEKYAGRIVAIIIALLCIERVKTPSDSFYWYNGSIHYTFFQSMVLLIISLELVATMDKEVQRRKAACAVACILSVFTGGANYISASSIVLISITIFCIYFGIKHEINMLMLPVIGIQLVTLCVNIAAPGNRNRASDLNADTGVFEAIMQSFSKAFVDIGDWMDFPLLLTVLILIPIILYMLKDTEFEFPYPGMVSLYSICLLAAMRTPTYYAMGNEGPNRAENIVQFMFYFYFIFNCCYLIGHIQSRISRIRFCRTDEAVSLVRKKLYLRNSEKYVIVIIGILLLVVYCDDYNEYTTLSAGASLYYNEAQLYHAKCCEREEILKDKSTDGQKIELELLQIKPKVLFHKDITTTETDSNNSAMASYYDKAAVVGVQ